MSDTSSRFPLPMAIARRALPLPVRRALWRVGEIAWSKAGRWRVACSVCGWRFRSFRPAGHVPRENARCPVCGARERHRLQWLYLRNRTDLFVRPQRVLHFAPEPSFRGRLSRADNLWYVTTDLSETDVALNTDITALPFPAGTFDVILCNHVLEHVPDDGAALRELFRVLRDGGWAVVQVPMDSNRASTFEDPSVREPSERLRLFGQADHVRVYGRDYIDRVEAAGFRVDSNRFVDELPRGLVEMHGLSRESIFIARKPVGASRSRAGGELPEPEAR